RAPERAPCPDTTREDDVRSRHWADRTDRERGRAPRPGGFCAGPRFRRVGAVLTSLSALIGTSLVTGPVAIAAGADSCALERTDIHHSEGLDTWHPDYPRPART